MKQFAEIEPAADGGEGNLSTRAGDDATFRKRAPGLLQDFQAYLLDEMQRSPRTARTYLWSLRQLETFTGKPLQKITPGDLRLFKRESSLAPATLQGVVVAMHQFHKWGALEGHWERNGMLDVPTPRVRNDPRAPMSLESARRLIEVCETPLDLRVIYLGLFAGLRIAEAAALCEEHWMGDRLTFRGKADKKRSVPVHPELKRIRYEILGQQPKTSQVLQSNVARLRERAGVHDLDMKPVTSHTLRRTFATTLYEKCEVPYEVVAKLLGHGVDVTARYVRVPYERMKEAIEHLDYYGGEPVQLRLEF